MTENPQPKPWGDYAALLVKYKFSTSVKLSPFCHSIRINIPSKHKQPIWLHNRIYLFSLNANKAEIVTTTHSILHQNQYVLQKFLFCLEILIFIGIPHQRKNHIKSRVLCFQDYYRKLIGIHNM